jgi:hypothetical protein
MRARGLEPTAATFGTLISIAADAHAAGRVREAWGELQRCGLPVYIAAANAYLAVLLREVRRNWGCCAYPPPSTGPPCRLQQCVYHELVVVCQLRSSRRQPLP